MAIKKILVFGEEDLEYDNGAIKLIAYLKTQLSELEYIIFKISRPEQILDFIGTDFIILDVAKGISKPTLITNLDSINYGKKVTTHDMDLAAFLKVLKNLGEIKSVPIVALPNDQDTEKFKEEVVSIIKNIK